MNLIINRFKMMINYFLQLGINRLKLKFMMLGEKDRKMFLTRVKIANYGFYESGFWIINIKFTLLRIFLLAYLFVTSSWSIIVHQYWVQVLFCSNFDLHTSRQVLVEKTICSYS